MIALITGPVPQADDITRFTNFNSFLKQSSYTASDFDNHNVFLHGTEGDFPYEGAALAVHLGRLISVAMGAGTIFTVWGITRSLDPSRPGTALLATALFASVPGIIYVFSMITNDASVILFDTLGLFIAVRIARTGASARLAIAGGVVAGAATLSKLSGAWIIGVVWVALIGAVLIELGRMRPRLAGLLKKVLPVVAISGVIWLLVCGWWFIFGLFADGDPLGFSMHRLAGPGAYNLPPFFFVNSLGSDLLVWDRTTWYSPAWAFLFGPTWIYSIFRYIYVAGLSTVYVRALWLMTDNRRRTEMPVEILLGISILLVIFFTTLGAFLWLLTGPWWLGRLLYTGFGGTSALAAIGLLLLASYLRRLRLPTWTPRVALAGVIFIAQGAAWYCTSFTLTALNPHGLFSPTSTDISRTQLTYLDPSDGKTPVAGLTGFRVHADDFTLLDATEESTVGGSLAGSLGLVDGFPSGYAIAVDLCWKSHGYLTQSFPYSAELVGPGDAVLGMRNSYHGFGSYPIVRWRPGEEFCDPTTIRVTKPVIRPRAYNLVVTLFPMLPPAYHPGAPLPVVDAANKHVYPIAGRVRVAPQYMPIVTPTYQLGELAGLTGESFQVLPGSVLSITLRWLALKQNSIDARVLLQVIDQDTGKVIAQDDHQPDGGWFPTSYWLTGDVIDDAFQIKLPDGVNANRVSLGVGMYIAQSGQRLQAIDARTRERVRNDIITLRLNAPEQ